MIIQSAYSSVLQITFLLLHLLRRQNQGITHGNWQDKGQSLTKMSTATPYHTELSWSRQSGQGVICAWPKFINPQWFQLGLQQILAPLKQQILKMLLTQSSNRHWILSSIFLTICSKAERRSDISWCFCNCPSKAVGMTRTSTGHWKEENRAWAKVQC